MARLDPARALILGDRVPRASPGIVAYPPQGRPSGCSAMGPQGYQGQARANKGILDLLTY